MKDLKKLCFSILILTIPALRGLAQDHMYSQFFDAPVYLNPALSGQFDGDLRMNFIYRSQWTASPAALSYYTASIDLKIPQFGGGVGLMFTRSNEGPALTQNNVSGVYSYSVGSDDFILSFGLQAGFTNRSVDWSKLVFSDQIDPILGFQPGSISSAEAPLYNNKFFFDSGAGLNLVTGDFMIGTALQHINQPNESFTGAPAKLPILGKVHASYRWDLNSHDDVDDDDKSYVIPSVVFYKQSQATSLSIGAQYKHKGVNVGLWYRNGGAAIDGQNMVVLSLIFDLFINKEGGEKLRLGVDHEASVSGVNYSNTAGTTEGSLGYETTLPSRTDYDKFDKSRQCYHFY